MKKLFTLFAMLTLLVSLNAQTINYQAVLRDTIDGKIELVRNQKLYATISLQATINGDPTEVTAIDSMPCKTNADGMVDLKIDFSELEGQLSDATDDERGRIDWRNNVITAKFEYGESNSIVLETPVTAVPYAIQAKDGILTTSVITNYINSTAGGEQADFDSVWNAVMRNEQLRKDINDSIVEFLKQKENYEIAKDIIYGYLSQVSSADVREAYNLARSVDTATKDTIIFVMKDFVNTHHKLVIEALEYYAQTATEEEMRSIYETLKTRVGTTVKDLLYQYFNHYMETKGLVCQGKNLCDAIAAMNAGGDAPQTELKCLEISKQGTNFSENACLYYKDGETYGQALNHPENSHWGAWTQNYPDYETLWYKETLPNGSSMDLYVNGDHDFLGGNGHEGTFHGQPSDVTWGTKINPANTHSFGLGF